MNEQLVADIQATRHVLMERGWCQGVGIDKKGRRCLIAACSFTVDQLNSREEANRRYDNLLNHIRKIIWPRGIPDWNDTSNRTFDQVLALLDKAEAIAREQ